MLIKVDGLAIDVVDEDDLGWANSAQVVGFKIGMLMGGGVLLWASTALGLGWSGVFLAMATLVLAALACFNTFGAHMGRQSSANGSNGHGGAPEKSAAHVYVSNPS